MSNALKDPEALTEMFEALRLDSAKSADASTAAAAKVDEGTLLFELLDLNRDGQLTRMEIARGFKTLVKAGVPVGVSADAFFKAADGDSDAKVPSKQTKRRACLQKDKQGHMAGSANTHPRLLLFSYDYHRWIWPSFWRFLRSFLRR
jgi:hypothetical protein